MIVALPALDVFRNFVVLLPPTPFWLVIVALPAVELLRNSVEPGAPGNLLLLVSVCVSSELFTIPAPCTASPFPFVLIANTLAPGWKVIDSTVTPPDRSSKVWVEVLKVALSPGLTGALGDVDQLAPAFQSPDPGSDNQTASRARTGVHVAIYGGSAMKSARTEVTAMPERFSMKEVRPRLFTGQALMVAKRSALLVGFLSLTTIGAEMFIACCSAQ